MVAREFLFINPPKKSHSDNIFDSEKIFWYHKIYSSIIYVCTHHEEVSPCDNLVGPQDFLVIKRLFSRSILVDYVNQTICALTTRRFHREKILRDHEIYSSIILCVHPPRGGLTVRKSCGTTCFTHDQKVIF